MAHNLRFRGEWRDMKGGLSRFDILQRDYYGNAEVMVMQEDPLTLERAALSNKFQPSVGSGIQLKVEAAYDGQYAHLYTNDKQKYKAHFYKNDKIVWKGYLNSEVYSEQYDRNANYPVTLQFNDGFTVMERIPFLDGNGEPYKGLKTVWQVIWIILNKLDVGYKYVYVACDVYEVGMNTLTSPFHQMKVDCGNYYDEKGDPMNCREVLNALVKLQRAVCFQNEGCLNIVSVPLLTGSFQRRRYSSEASTQVLQTVNPVITIPTQADWYAADQNLDIVSGFNKATLKYSPYAAEEVIESSDFSETKTWEGSPDWVDVGDFYELQGVTGVDGWKFLNGTSFTGTKEEEIDDNEVYFKLPFAYDDDSEVSLVENNVDGALVTGVENQGFKVKFKVYVATKNNEFDSSEESKNVFRIESGIVFEIDGKRLKYAKQPWQTGDFDDSNVRPIVWSLLFHIDKPANIADSWQDVEIKIPGNCPHGKIKLQVLKRWQAYKDTNRTPVDSGDIKHIRVKDIEVSLANIATYTAQSGTVSYDYTDVNFSDLEFTANMDENWLNEAENIEMIHGDSKHNNCTDRGGLHLLDNSFTGSWKATGDTQAYDISAIILRSHQSNYRNSLKWLGGTLEAPNFFSGNGENISGILSFHSVLTYPGTSLGDRKLMCLGGTFNDKRQTLKGSWLEVLADDLTINMTE